MTTLGWVQVALAFVVAVLVIASIAYRRVQHDDSAGDGEQ